MPKQASSALITISEPTLRRLPVYYDYLKMNYDDTDQNVSTSEIARALHLKPIQVRKDLQMTGVSGKPKVGYVVREVMAAIEDTLGYNNTKDAFLVGAGNLGQALLGYDGFRDYGLNIVAAFDNDPRKMGRVNRKYIYELSRLPELAPRLKIKIGIITTPAAHAQRVCDIMVAAGIKGIWNFAPTRLKVPEDVIVQNENMTSSLAILSNRLVEK